jgi:hypothetical protein
VGMLNAIMMSIILLNGVVPFSITIFETFMLAFIEVEIYEKIV